MKIEIHNQGPYHYWGDSWPHWDSLYAAESYIYNYVYKRSLCRASLKEKYGTLRYEFVTPPKWTWNKFKIYFPWMKFGRAILRRAIKKAAKKYPECAAEILDDEAYLDD